MADQINHRRHLTPDLSVRDVHRPETGERSAEIDAQCLVAAHFRVHLQPLRRARMIRVPATFPVGPQSD
jgi:hypothetical protein